TDDRLGIRRMKAWHHSVAFAPLASLFVAACDPGTARAPNGASASTARPLPPLDPPDAGMLDLLPVADAGTHSDCYPSVPNDGNAESAVLAGDKLSVCVRFAAATPQSRDGRVCYEVNLSTGIYSRVPAFNAPPS